MMTEHSKQFVTDSLKRAEQSLQAANILFEEGLLADSVSRAYYAMFHASVAILYARGLRAKSHSGTINLFGEHLVNKGIVSKEAGRSLKEAFTMRQRGDYELAAEFDRNQVEALIKQATAFIEQIKTALVK